MTDWTLKAMQDIIDESEMYEPGEEIREVWVVMEYSEATGPVSAHATEEGAIEAAKQMVRDMGEGEGLEPVQDPSYTAWCGGHEPWVQAASLGGDTQDSMWWTERMTVRK